MGKDFKTIGTELSKPFAPEDLEWRLQTTSKDGTKGLAVPYVTNRAIQDRLDEVVGTDNWRNEYKPWHGSGKRDAQLCGISIYNEERNEWITKWDGAEDTDIEPVKGGLSDSMKRAAVHWGVGRILYKMDTVWVEVEQRGKTTVIKPSERSKLDRAYLNTLKKLGLSHSPAGGVQSELTPASGGEEKPAAQPKADKKVQPHSKAEYTVVKASVQPTVSGGKTMSLTLKGRDGKEKRAFLRGEDAKLIPGAELTGVKLAYKEQSSVAFYILEGYEIMNEMPMAA